MQHNDTSFNPDTHYFGKICKRGHEWEDSGQSLRRKSGRDCIECRRIARGGRPMASTLAPSPNPSGICMCGCGQPTSIARQTDSRRGAVKGEPLRYRTGHRGRKPGAKIMTRRGGYVRIYSPDSLMADRRGYVLEHREIAAQKLGRPLTSEEVVHHIDGVKTNNSPDNLLVTTQSAHARIHAGGDQLSAPNGYIGINRKGNKWRARIKFNGQTLHVGVFSTAEGAARARDSAARALHGRYAKLNFTDT